MKSIKNVSVFNEVIKFSKSQIKKTTVENWMLLNSHALQL